MYTGDDPLNRTDPTGLFDWGLALGITAGVVGIAALTISTAGVGDLTFLGAGIGIEADIGAAGLGAVSTGVDCSHDWKSLQCGLDTLSLGFGGAGIVGDFSHLGRAFSMAMGGLSDVYTWESVGVTIYDDTRDDDEDASSRSSADGSTSGDSSSFGEDPGNRSSGVHSSWGSSSYPDYTRTGYGYPC
ncbi:hypothetical protein [Propionibacterium cyclohexanicum]|uniref:hypothetical protein n=1 Tax=Propionibacterium cyclohexanicum TaxID=64702 RepID=UPI001C43231E|nr:hypothetical protein [Propionibacterium cyclohexanicum]